MNCCLSSFAGGRDGIRWFQRYLVKDDQKPIKHPAVFSGFGSKAMGLELDDNPERTAAILIPSVGCPIGCNFCSTYDQFGGKGKFINFLRPKTNSIRHVRHRAETESPLLLYARLKIEEADLATGHTYEPRSFCEENLCWIQ